MGGMLNWAFRDVFMLMIAVLILMVNPPEEAKQEAEISAQGQLVFEIAWDPRANVDIDIWVLPPGEPYVSFQNKGGRSCNLLRDDVGILKDDLGWQDPSNQEILVCRNPVADQEWVANAHYYSTYLDADYKMIPVTVYYRVMLHDGSSITVKDKGSFILNVKGEEHTMIKFKISESGDIYGITREFHSLFIQSGPHGDGR